MKRWLTNHQRVPKPAAAKTSNAPNAMNSRLRSIVSRAAKSTVRSGFSRTKAEKPGRRLLHRSWVVPAGYRTPGQARSGGRTLSDKGPAGAESGRGHSPAAPAGRGEGAEEGRLN